MKFGKKLSLYKLPIEFLSDVLSISPAGVLRNADAALRIQPAHESDVHSSRQIREKKSGEPSAKCSLQRHHQVIHKDASRSSCGKAYVVMLY